MSTYKINNPEGIYFITFAVVEWIDVFIKVEYKDFHSTIQTLKKR